MTRLPRSDYTPAGWYLFRVQRVPLWRRVAFHWLVVGTAKALFVMALGALFGLAIVDAIVTGPPVPLP
jgi:hypothetical protein